MSKYKKTHQISTETMDAAMKIAKHIQKPNQTKEQTKLITQGIQKGIAEYKKQQKAKARELDKLKKKIMNKQQDSSVLEPSAEKVIKCKVQWLPWALLIISWLIMAVIIIGSK